MSVESENKNAERLAILETEVASIKELLVRMDVKLDAWNNTFVPRQELSEMFRARDKEIQELKDTRKDNRSLLVAWVSAAVAMIAVIVGVWPHK